MLYASFVKATGIYNSWFNKVVAKVTRGNFCHSEFVFRWNKKEAEEVLQRVKGFGRLRSLQMSDDSTVDVAVYILWGGVVQYRILNGVGEFYSFPSEHFLRINTSWKSELNTISWLAGQMGTSYDHWGAVLYGIPLRRANNTYENYFCSQLMACALQRLGYFKHLNPASLTPNGLYRQLQLSAK